MVGAWAQRHVHGHAPLTPRLTLPPPFDPLRPSQNYAYLYGGAVFPMYGFFTATRTRIVSNGAQQGGGAIKIIAGGAQLTGCEVSWNRAKFGGAFDVYKLEGISWPPTIITVQACAARP